MPDLAAFDRGRWRAMIPGMLKRGRGRIVITGSGSAYLPGGRSTAYAPSKAAVRRYGEMLANGLGGQIPAPARK